MWIDKLQVARVPRLIQIVESCLVVSIGMWKGGGGVGGARREVGGGRREMGSRRWWCGRRQAGGWEARREVEMGDGVGKEKKKN